MATYFPVNHLVRLRSAGFCRNTTEMSGREAFERMNQLDECFFASGFREIPENVTKSAMKGMTLFVNITRLLP